MRTHSRQAGLSLIETAITLSVMMMITAVMAPAGMTLVQQARELQVQRDCATLRDAMVKLLVDTNQMTLKLGQGRGPLVETLVTSGATPEVDGGGDARWLQAVNGTGTVDLIDHYLVDNQPAGSAANAWPAPSGLEGGWRGAYLPTAPAADPWGHRYAMNVKYLNTHDDVVVLSAGANGLIETPFTGRGLLPGGDDVLVLVR